MENKYQNSLNYVYHNMTDIHENGKNELSFKAIENLVTLQELIDKYSKPSCEHHCEIVDMLREQFMAAEIENGKLEKGLDKACKDCELLDKGLAYETSWNDLEVDSWEVRKKRYLEESENNSNGN